MKPEDLKNWEMPDLNPKLAPHIGRLVFRLAQEDGLFVALETAVEHMKTLDVGRDSVWVLTLLDALEQELGDSDQGFSNG